MARALVNLPRTARRGVVIEVKALIAHPMETGYRPGPNGAMLPRDIVTRFACTFNGTPVFEAELSPATSANPYLSFFLRATESGTLTLTWTGDNGFRQTETAALVVT